MKGFTSLTTRQLLIEAAGAAHHIRTTMVESSPNISGFPSHMKGAAQAQKM
jgi:hypothetical protein